MTTTVLFYDFDGTEYTIPDSAVIGVETTRGRTADLEDIQKGTFSVALHNNDRSLDPFFVTSSGFLTQGNGDYLLQGNGDRLIATFSSNSFGPYGAIGPGRKIVIKDGAAVVMTGYVETFDYQYTRNGNTVVMSGFDAMGTLEQSTFTEWTTTEWQKPGARLNAALSRPEVNFPVAKRSFDTGINPLAGAVIDAGTDVLPYLQNVARSDLGRLFVSRTGVLTFLDRHSPVGSSPAVTFTASLDANIDADDFMIGEVDIQFGAQQYHAAWLVERVGGIAQTATNDAVIALYEDELGVRQQSITGLLLAHDAYAKSMAEGLAVQRASVAAAVSGLTVKLDRLTPANRATVAALEIGDYVAMSWVPTGAGNNVSQQLLVEGVNYSAQRDSPKTVTLQLSEFNTTGYWTLEDADLGTIDSTPVLAF